MPRLRRTWQPHAAQHSIMHSDARFRVVAAGRRGGKTEMARHDAVDYGWENPGSHIWWVAPTYTDANELGYDGIKAILPESIIKRVKLTEPRELEIINGTLYSFRSGERVDSLRGRGLDRLYVDEAGSVPDRAYTEELRPSLSDTLGSMLAIGTPRGRNWFQTLYHRGLDEAENDVQSFHYTTYDNPYVEDSEVEAARAELPERVFKQEYLAEFMDNEGAVFGDVAERNVGGYTLPVDPATTEPPFTIGVDLGRKQNFTGIIVVDAQGSVVQATRDRGGTWAGVASSVKAVAGDFAPATLYLDATRDNAVIENIERELAVGVEPVKFTASKKRDLIENLAARLEMGDLDLPADGQEAQTLISELQAYEYSTTPSGNITYQAPSGVHDDLVDALALAAQEPVNVSRGTW